MDNKALINIMIVDDHDVLRQSLSRWLDTEEDFKVVHEARNGQEAIRFLEDESTPPVNIVLMDLFMGEEGNEDPNGLTASRYILKNLYVRGVNEIKIIILTTSLSGLHIKKAYDMRVPGYLPKECEIQELIDAIRLVKNGKMYYRGRVREEMEKYLQKDFEDNGNQEFKDPTPSEFEILEMIAQGLTTKEIADKRGVGVDGIEAHRRNLMKKLNANNASQLVSIAYKKGLLKIY